MLIVLSRVRSVCDMLTNICLFSYVNVGLLGGKYIYGHI